MAIVIDYKPRDLMMPFHNRTKRWSVVVAHRRFGKTVANVNELIRGALTCPKPEGRFAYVAPTFGQAKDITWNYLNRFSQGLGEGNISELRFDYLNGARVRLYGSDNINRMRGVYLDGVVLDEFGDQDPRVWTEVLRPALSDRKGWAVFIGTPRGKNHFHDMWETAQANPDEWFSLMLKASQTGILDEEELSSARQMMSAEQYAAEYECDFGSSIIGAYYSTQFAYLDENGRLGNFVWEPSLSVTTAWDLGIDDSTAIWFVQRLGNEVRVIDYIENNGVGLDWYLKTMRDKPYLYERHIMPHDIEVREYGTGKSRIETLQGMGINPSMIKVLPRMAVEDGIEAARMLLPKCWFNADATKAGVAALRNYRRRFDNKRNIWLPCHDWSSHGADAFRYLALGLDDRDMPGNAWAKPIQYKSNWVV